MRLPRLASDRPLVISCAQNAEQSAQATPRPAAGDPAAALERGANVIVVVVHHRGQDLLDRCLRSLAGSRGARLQVIVVANACREELPACDPAELPVHVVVSEESLGFSTANNVAIEWAAGNLPPADYYFFLNNDTVVAPDAIQVLTRDLDEHPEWAIAGPCLKILGAENHLNSLGINVSRIGEAWDEGIGRPIAEYGPLPGKREVLAVTGSALLIRADVYHRVDGWTEFYRYYLEDVDLCLKVRSCGYGVVNDPEATVLHVVSATSSTEFKTLLTWRNQILLMITRWPSSLLVRVLPLFVVRSAALYLRRRHARAGDDARLQARAWQEAMRLLPRALAMRRRTSGRHSRWVDLLLPAGSVPAIRLPELASDQRRGERVQGPPR